MNVFYEEEGAFKVGAVLVDNTTSLQVEAPHGKRSKIKAGNVLFRFDQPQLADFMSRAQKMAEDLDPNFLWECCEGGEEFGYETLARDYFGHPADPVEAAGVLLRLHGAPMHFYKRGRGRYRAAPADALKAALASQERKRTQALQQARYVAQFASFTLPPEFKPMLSRLLYKPDKASVEFKALEEACAAMKLAPAKLLDRCGALPSSHDYHLNRFLFEYFPLGTGFGDIGEISEPADLPVADTAAFSIDDATTTEIDDAFSVTLLADGARRIGIHIAAPALGFAPDSPLDRAAAERLSTVYLPGNKITMLPEEVIHRFTLGEERLCPALSMYFKVSRDYSIVSVESRIERVRVAANLRHDTLEEHFNEYTLAEDAIHHPFGGELRILWEFASSLEAARGKSADANTGQMDYNFYVENDRIKITERRRGSPIDKLVSELMICVNARWGEQLSEAGVAGIYRTQINGKVKMSTVAAPHQGLGVAQYIWASSPLRRYVDLLNQRQLVALLRGDPPPYAKDSERLFAVMRDFEAAYDAYAEFQRTMERYWCLRWLLQESVSAAGATVLRENLVKLGKLPLVARVPSLPEVPAGSEVELEISRIDLLDLTFSAKFLRKLGP